MSGPKGVSYQIAQEQMKRMELQNTRRRVGARLEGLRKQAGALQIAVPAEAPERVPESASLEALRRLDAQLVRAEESLAARVDEIARETARQSLAGVVASLELSIDLSPRSRAYGTAEAERILTRLAAATEVAGECPPDVSIDLNKLGRRALDALNAGEIARAAVLTASAESLVLDRKEAEKLRQQLERYRRALLASTLDLTTAEPLQARIHDARSMDELRAISDSVELARTEQSQEAVRQLVVAQTVAALEELGYVVDSTPTDTSTRLWAVRADWPAHGLDLVLPRARAEIRTVPTAVGVTDPRDDLAFEEQTCDDLAQLWSRLAREGVPSTLVRAQPVGAIPLNRTSQVRKKSTAQKERVIGQ